MADLISLTIMLIAGLMLLIMPVTFILKIDHGFISKLFTNSLNKKIAQRRVAIMYRLLGAFLVIATLLLMLLLKNNGALSSTFANSQPNEIRSADVSVTWIRSIKATDTMSRHNMTFISTSLPQFPNGTSQVFIYFYTQSSNDEIIAYRWNIDSQTKREFISAYNQGDNFIPLNIENAPMPPGLHEVYMYARGGVILATVRFRVAEQ